MRISSYPSILILTAVALLVAFGPAAIQAQGKTGSSETGESLAALTAEVHQLRLAIEELTRSQTQAQALGIYLSAEQSRIVQLATRLDSVRKELDTADARSHEMTSQLANIEAQLNQGLAQDVRTLYERESRMLKQELERLATQEQQIRNRESEITQSLQLEENRWTDLISKLEQLIKR